MVGFSEDGARRIARAVKKLEAQRRPAADPVRADTMTRLLVRGTLDATLGAAGSCLMTVYTGNNTATSTKITVYDWYLNTNETIASGTKVGAMLDIGTGRYYVVCVRCP